MKWSDWQAEMSDGFAWKRKLLTDRVKDERYEPPWTRWPCETQQILLRTENGQAPRGVEDIGVGDWIRVWNLKDVDNLYDLGLWDNLKDVFLPDVGPPQGTLSRASSQEVSKSIP